MHETTPPPVFVDDGGRRRALARRAGRLLVLGFVGYLGLLAAGFAGDPHLGPLALPTFGVPSLGLAPQSAPQVLGEATTQAVAEGTEGSQDAGRSPTSPKAALAGAPSSGASGGRPPVGGGPGAGLRGS